MMDADSESNNVQKADTEFSQELRERAERNRQKALFLRSSKLIAHPYAKKGTDDPVKGRLIKVRGQRVIDSGGGFLIEENEELENEMVKITADPPPIPSDLLAPNCKECNKKFRESYLFRTFDLPVCDECRDREDKHTLITKTEAKQQYLLKDCDFDKREPPLKCIIRKNPHNANWGDMKLYLQLQVEQRALEVWGTEEKLLEEKEKRNHKREETKVKKFNKGIKKLRMQVRSSLYDRTTKAAHEHEFGKDTYNEEDDTYTHICTICGYNETYEKM